MKSAAAHMCHKIDECITFITLKKLLLTVYIRQVDNFAITLSQHESTNNTKLHYSHPFYSANTFSDWTLAFSSIIADHRSNFNMNRRVTNDGCLANQTNIQKVY